MCDKIFVQLREFDMTHKSTYVVDESEELNADSATEARALLASLFPGVSRAAVDNVPDVAAFETDREQDNSAVRWEKTQGMGLYALRRIVIDQFGGNLVIRSGDYRLKMESAHDAYKTQYRVRYKCKITRYPRSYPSFNGNLLVIHLPLAE
jgi:hypothetical protein